MNQNRIGRLEKIPALPCAWVAQEAGRTRRELTQVSDQDASKMNIVCLECSANSVFSERSIPWQRNGPVLE